MVRFGFMTLLCTSRIQLWLALAGLISPTVAASSLAASIGNTNANGLITARDAGNALTARAQASAKDIRIAELQDLNAKAEKKLLLGLEDGGFANPDAGRAQIGNRNAQIEQLQTA